MIGIIFLLTFTTSNLFAMIPKDELLGKIDPKKHPDFVRIKSYNNSFWIRREVAVKLIEMIEEAKKDGIELKVISAFRSFSSQKNIWERKIKRFSAGKSKREAVRETLKYSAMPGTSRHHWGTDVDLVSLEPSFYDTPYGRKVFLWLSRNAQRFGFFMPYSPNRKNKNGYKEEKWHWSYNPLAREFLSNYIEVISYKDLCGFTGCEFVEEFDIFSNFVLNIDEEEAK
ncbi:MAG: M15 family metallopeptidase [Brevinematia bacterium]